MTITIGNSQGIPMGKYTPSTGGGGADLSNYYTKEETYNQEEVDTLLDTKQEVLTSSMPIEIGTTTIGEPNNINIVGGGIVPTTSNIGDASFAIDYTSITNAKNSNTVVDTFNSSFKDLPYFDIALNLSNYFTDDYSNQQALKINIGGMSSFNSACWAVLYFGKVSGNEFVPYICLKQAMFNSAGILGVASEQPILTSTTDTNTKWRLNGLAQSMSSTSVSDTRNPAMAFEINKSTGGSLTLNTAWYNGTTERKFSSNLNTSQWDLNKLRSCNAIRVVLRTHDNTVNYCPTTTDTYLEYNGSRLAWNIEDGIVKTYGIALKYDNQTIQVNSKGELVANSDELGNEVNAISSRVTTLETNTGGFKFVKLTQAEYDALETKDENTMYVING